MKPRKLVGLAAWLWVAIADGVSAQQHMHEHRAAAGAMSGDTAVGTVLRSQTITQAGATIELTLARPSGADEDTIAILEGEDVFVRLVVTDSATGEPLTRLMPAGWIDARADLTPTLMPACREKIQSYMRGTLQIRPAVDLNSSYVLALTAGNTVAVYDPIVGFNISKLYAAAPLPGGGEDWTLSPEEDQLFVTMPMLNSVAVVNTSIWRAVTTIPMGLRPMRIAFQPDGAYVWVTNEGTTADGSGVSAVNPASLETVIHIATGAGPHDITFSPDSRFAFVSNAGAGTVSVVDVLELREVAEIATGPRPIAVGYAAEGAAVYVADEEDGSVAVIDAVTHEIATRLPTTPGLETLAFHPAGRWGFAPNPSRNEVYVIDAATVAVIDTITFGEAPDQVGFTDNFAFLRSSGTPDVAMVSLEELAQNGQAMLMPFEAGRLPPTKYGSRSSAQALASAGHHSMDAVYVPNPAEKSIYLYHYMMNMPMPAGRVDAYPFEPKAVLVVNRALRERAPGVYTTTFKAPATGQWDVVFLLDEPRVVHCFDFTVESNPAATESRAPRIRIAPVAGQDSLPAGRPVAVQFSLVDDGRGGVPLPEVDDVWAWIFSPNNWNQRVKAEHIGDGVYSFDVTFPWAGAYNLVIASRSLGVGFEHTFPIVLHVAGDGSGSEGTSRP